MIGIPVVFIFLIIIVIAYAIYSSTVLERKHQDELAQFAKRHKLKFSTASGSNLVKAIFKSEVGSRGRGQRVANAVEGEYKGFKVCVCDYSYVTGSGKHRKTHRQSMLVMPAPIDLPEFQLRPENVLHKIGQALGYQDIDFRDHPLFSKQYLLRGKDEAAIRQAFNATVISRLEQVNCLCVESSRGHLFVWHDGRRQKVANLENFIMLALALATAFKAD